LRWALPGVMGSVLEYTRDSSASATASFTAYVTGDTLMFDGIHEIARRYSGIDLCVLHLGGTRIGGVLLTMDADQGVRAVQVIQPRAVVPVHYDDYTVFRSPLADFLDAARRAGVAASIVDVKRGVPWQLSVSM